MTTPNIPDEPCEGAEVVSLDAARASRPAPDAELAAESAAGSDTAPDIEAVMVDTPGGHRGDWRAELAARHHNRRPVIPGWLHSRADAVTTARWLAAHLAHVSAYHAVRTPAYGAKLAARSPRGLAKVVTGAVRWTFDLEGHPVRMATVAKADPEAYLKLSRQRDSRVRLRAGVTIVALAVALYLALVAATGPAPLRFAVLALVVAVLGVIGAPADRPLIDRAVVVARVEKLTSDIVLRALGALGIPAINQAITKNPRTGVAFVAPITRDGPGWRADMDLPHGVTVSEVMDKRDKLASGLRRQLGCVWPEADHGQHPGRLVLWVGDQDMSKVRQPAWPLAKHGSADMFSGTPFGTDQRGRLVPVTLMFVSAIIGSIPRMGKTFLLRLLALVAALDPRAELHLFDFKGTGDLSPLECVAHRYRAGDDDEDMAYVLADFRELREELRRRTKVIRGLPRDICPASRVTPELASKKSLGLHPIFIGADECQVMFEHPKYGAEFEEICTDLVKRGPALAMILALATQRPDAKSIPPGISANAVLRLCLKVMGWRENDMVLGDGAHGRGTRATMFSFSDKGICYFSGEGEAPRIVRAFYIDAPAAEKIALRARGVRAAAGTLSGHALGQEPDTGPTFDLLADIAAVVSEPKLWSEVVVTRLAEFRPEVYGPWGELEPDARAAQLTSALRPYGVKTGQVWGTTGPNKGANRRGITRDDITTAITHRNEKSGPAGAA